MKGGPYHMHYTLPYNSMICVAVQFVRWSGSLYFHLSKCHVNKNEMLHDITIGHKEYISYIGALERFYM